LLESIGVLYKYIDSYYPTLLVDIEYFVKQNDIIIYDNLYNFMINIKDVDELVSKDTALFGMKKFRNKLTISARDECSILIEWLQ